MQLGDAFQQHPHSRTLGSDLDMCDLDGFKLIITATRLVTPCWSRRPPLIKKLLERLAEPYVIDRRDLHLTGSVGISVYPEHGTEANSLIRHADEALYVAKRSGKNQFRFYGTWLTIDVLVNSRHPGVQAWNIPAVHVVGSEIFAGVTAACELA